MFEQEPFSLNPIHFFAISCDCHYLKPKDSLSSAKKFNLPSTQSFTQEKSFAQLAMGWNEQGLKIRMESQHAVEHTFYPNIEKGESLELFFDTRDLKSKEFNTRFCHHFFFLPKGVEGVSKGEKTHFRTEDSHPLCDPDILECQTNLGKRSFEMDIFIPSQALYGYDPNQFSRLGFTYKINRYRGSSQHFSVTSEDYQINQNPSLWASLQLVK